MNLISGWYWIYGHDIRPKGRRSGFTVKISGQKDNELDIRLVLDIRSRYPDIRTAELNIRLVLDIRSRYQDILTAELDIRLVLDIRSRYPDIRTAGLDIRLVLDIHARNPSNKTMNFVSGWCWIYG